jgi:predicted nucleotidyltransferase
MNLEMLENMGWIIYKSVTGSHAYGTNIPTSDRDIRGIFVMPLRERLSLTPLPSEVGDHKQDIKFYELKKFIELATDCNPNICEFLFMPKDCIEYIHPLMQKIIDNRHLFISKKAYHTHSGYAFAQIKKAKGENKWVNNPKPKEPPTMAEFCRVIPMTSNNIDVNIVEFWRRINIQPARPIPLDKFLEMSPSWNLNHFHVAALEHVPDTYRLYYYGEGAKGVFRNGNLACESIPMDDEYSKFYGLLIYNHQEYEKAKMEWKNYWTWVKERNPARWKSQEDGEMLFDGKNMLHCFRLLMSGKSILENGVPIIRFEGEQLQFLKDIRAGKYKYEELIIDVEKRMENLKTIYETSTLPHSPDKQKIDDLYREIVFA